MITQYYTIENYFVAQFFKGRSLSSHSKSNIAS